MSGHEALVFMITALIIAAAATTLFIQTGQQAQQGITIEQEPASIRAVSAVVFNVTDKQGPYIRFAVTSDAGSIAIDQTLITIRTQQEVADLQYRNGTLNRSVETGFYTQ